MAEVTCTGETAHYDNGRELLKWYDKDNNGRISKEEVLKATTDHEAGLLTDEEVTFIILCYLDDGAIDKLCPVVTITANAKSKVYVNGILKANLT